VRASSPRRWVRKSRPDAEGYLKLTQSGVSDSFAQDLTDTEKLVLYSAQSPTAGAALGGTVSAPAWRGKTCRYLVATNDRAIQPALQRSMAKRLNAAVVEVAASHVAILSHPQEVASLIAGQDGKRGRTDRTNTSCSGFAMPMIDI
jgi:Alpha/beta hydrolase family